MQLLSPQSTAIKATLAIAICVIATAAGCQCGKDDDKGSTKALRNQQDNNDSAVAFRVRNCEAVEDSAYENGRAGGGNTLLEIVGGGVGAIDTDLDGYVDLIFPGGGHIDMQAQQVTGAASSLLRGDGNWEFENVTGASRLDTALIYSHGISSADYDNDGFPDLLISGYQGVQLWKNQGDGTFLNVTASAGLTAAPWTTSAAWIDVGQDGVLDLYLASYVQWDFDTHQVCSLEDGVPNVCSPIVFAANGDAFYSGSDDGTYVRRDEMFPVKETGKGLGVLAANLIDDRNSELYVANDLTANYLFAGKKADASGGAASPQPFQNIAFEAGCAGDDKGKMNASMGIALLDFNRDQRFDIVVSNFSHEDVALYQQEQQLFVHSSGMSGLSNANTGVIGFGLVAADFDGDADEDLMLTSGHVHYHPVPSDMGFLPLYFNNNSGKRWTRLTPGGSNYFKSKPVGRGLAVGDLDNDGDVDAIVAHLNTPPTLLDNTVGQDNSWLKMRLIGRDSCRDAFGAVAAVHIGDVTMVRQRYSGGSYLSQNQAELCWGWPDEKSVTVEVKWPNGTTTRLTDVKPNQTLTLLEPQR